MCVSLPAEASLTPCQQACHRTLRRDPPAPRHRHRERGTELARPSAALRGAGGRGKQARPQRERAAERVPLAEPRLGAVPGNWEDFTSGGAGAGLPWVFKLCLCVAAWQTRAVTLSVSRAGLGELNKAAPALLPPCSSDLLAAP